LRALGVVPPGVARYFTFEEDVGSSVVRVDGRVLLRPYAGADERLRLLADAVRRFIRECSRQYSAASKIPQRAARPDPLLLICWTMDSRRAAQVALMSEEGARMGRRSLLHVAIDAQDGDGSIEVGGHVVPIPRAHVELL